MRPQLPGEQRAGSAAALLARRRCQAHGAQSVGGTAGGPQHTRSSEPDAAHSSTARSAAREHLDGGLALEVRDDVPGVRLELRQRARGQQLARVLQRAEHDVPDARLRARPHSLALKTARCGPRERTRPPCHCRLTLPLL